MPCRLWNPVATSVGIGSLKLGENMVEKLNIHHDMYGKLR